MGRIYVVLLDEVWVPCNTALDLFMLTPDPDLHTHIFTDRPHSGSRWRLRAEQSTIHADVP